MANFQIILIILINLHIYFQNLAQGTTYRECDYDRYANTGGCFAAANFICDTETNLCKCSQDAPILIDGRYCLKRSKENDICENNKQCDNSKGIYCSFSDYKLVNSSLTHPGDHLRQERPRCRYVNKELIEKHKQSTSKSLKASSTQQYNSFDKNNQHKKSNQSASFISYLPRIILIFLTGCIVGLIVLLILIKSQFYRIGRSFQDQTEDHLSVNSELEEPPPYEIAIRMKL